MKKCLPISLLVSLLCFGAAGCGGGKTSSQPSGTTTSSSSVAKVVVESVGIVYDGETTVLAGSSIKLSAEVKMSDGSKGKVEWSTSDESVAIVNNGSVKFKNVLEDKPVTITATSKDDASKSASITFTAKYSPINFANSRGNFDSSLFLEDGSVIVEKGDSALMVNEVYGTKWYVEADITPSDDLGTPEDQYPKFGIMTGSSAEGVWNQEQKTLFYFVDAQNPAASNSWTSMGVVGQNDNYTDWNWGGVQSASVTGDNNFAKNETTKIGLMRDGINYYLFAGRENGYGVIKHILNDHFAADEASYAWFGGWQTAYTLSNVSYAIGDAIDSKYESVTSITLGSYEQTLYINDTYQLDYKLGTDMYNPSKLTFTSSDPTVATVSNTGLVTAGAAAGSAVITVAYEDVEAKFNVEVTEDAFFKVELNGQMDDALWSESVKAHKKSIKAGEQYVDIYAARNSKGIYVYGDYVTNEVRNNGGEWWQQDNVEWRFVTKADPSTKDTDQIWISSMNGGATNAKDGHVTPLTLNEETNKYEMQFEIFIPYNDERLTADPLDAVGFQWGTASIAGWVCGNGWYEGNFDATHPIYYFDETVCEEHMYGDYKIITNSSCANDGLEHRTCYVCGRIDEKTTPKGEHNYSEVLSTVPSTCTTHGTQEVKCPGCQDVKTVELSLDPGYHEAGATYADGKWSCCNETIGALDRFDLGGWGDVNTWRYITKGLEGDFTVTTTYKLEVNGVQGNWWRGVLPIVQHDLGSAEYANGRHGSVWVTRFDWWGWCDQWQSSEKLTSQWEGGDMNAMKDVNRDMDWTDANGNNCADKYESTVTNCTVEWKCTRTGTTVVNNFTITAADGNVYTFWTKATDINESKKLNLAFSAEFARATISTVSIVK